MILLKDMRISEFSKIKSATPKNKTALVSLSFIFFCLPFFGLVFLAPSDLMLAVRF